MGSIVLRRRIVEDGVFKLDGIRPLYHRLGRSAAYMRLRGKPAAVMVPGVAGQFSGQGASQTGRQLFTIPHHAVLDTLEQVVPHRVERPPPTQRGDIEAPPGLDVTPRGEPPIRIGKDSSSALFLVRFEHWLRFSRDARVAFLRGCRMPFGVERDMLHAGPTGPPAVFLIQEP